jgi:chromate transport protein ChrA
MNAGATLAQIDIPTEFGSNEAMVLAILAFCMSPIISAITRLVPPGQWSSMAKAVLAFIVCVVAALLVVVARGQLNPADWFGTFLILFISAIALYAWFYKPSGIADAISGSK